MITEDRLNAWKTRLIVDPSAGERPLPDWLPRAWDAFHAAVSHPDYPCFFGTRALRENAIRHGFIEEGGLLHLPGILRHFLEHGRGEPLSNLAVFFEPVAGDAHEAVQDRFWTALRLLQDVDGQAGDAGAVDPDDPQWEFTFAGVQMFVVGASPTYGKRRSRNLGDGMLMLFQPREVFDADGAAAGDLQARAVVRKRLLAWDGMPHHESLGVYGDADNREWKQYFLPDGNEPVRHACPLARRSRPAPGTEDGRVMRDDRGFWLFDMPPPAPAILEEFDTLPLDAYTAGGQRRRRYSTFRASAADGSWRFDQQPQRPFLQPKSYNSVDGGVARRFEPIRFDPTPWMTAVFAAIGLAPAHDYALNLHQVRIVAGDGIRGVVVPEGPHRDGHELVLTAVFRRHNVSGGVSRLMPLGGGTPFFSVELEPGQALVLEDGRMWHHVTDIVSRDGSPGHRDVWIVSINRWEERRYGEEFEQRAAAAV